MSEPEGNLPRWREAFAGLSERAVPRPDCPDPDRLWATAIAEAPAAERQAIVEHMASCASCAGAFRLALGMSREERREERAGPASIEPLRRPSLPWFRRAGPLSALAAALLLAVLVPVWRQAQKAPPQYRDVARPEVRSEIGEGAVLLRQEAVLRWSAGPAGSLYEVRVLTREGREVTVEAGLEAPRYQIPPTALHGIPTGTLLYWQVKALRPDGTALVSKTNSIRIQ